MIRLPTLKTRKPDPVVLREKRAAPDQRWVGHVDVTVNLAACIRNLFLGITGTILALAWLLNPDMPLPLTLSSISALLPH